MWCANPRKMQYLNCPSSTSPTDALSFLLPSTTSICSAPEIEQFCCVCAMTSVNSSVCCTRCSSPKTQCFCRCCSKQFTHSSPPKDSYSKSIFISLLAHPTIWYLPCGTLAWNKYSPFSPSKDSIYSPNISELSSLSLSF